MLDFISEHWLPIVGVLFGAAIWYYRTFVLPLILENRKKQQFKSMGEPVMILMDFEGDDLFWHRVERARQRFLQSGNAFAKKQIPVIPFPRNVQISFDWFGVSHDIDTMGLGEIAYRQAADRFYLKLYGVWTKEIYGAHGEAIFYQTVKGNDPFDPSNVWADRKN